jgi:hypothetical protein
VAGVSALAAAPSAVDVLSATLLFAPAVASSLLLLASLLLLTYLSLMVFLPILASLLLLESPFADISCAAVSYFYCFVPGVPAVDRVFAVAAILTAADV